MNPWKELGLFKAVTSKDPNEKMVGALMFLNEEDDEESKAQETQNTNN